MTTEELNPFIEQINEVLIKYGFQKYNEPHFQLNDKFHHLWDYYYADGETRPSIELATQTSLVFGNNGFPIGNKEDVYIMFSD